MAKRTYKISAPSVFVKSAADMKAEAVNELLFGESVESLSCEDNGWTRIRSLTDNYEGYVPAGTLSAHTAGTTHKIKVLRSFVYETPDYKTPPLMALPFLSQISLTGNNKNGFALMENGGWIFEDHLLPEGTTLPDHVDTALWFVGAPYLWGGRTGAGLDCSALIQLCVQAAGRPCPRDSHQQQSNLGTLVTDSAYKRGDFVFFEKHVGLIVDDNKILNATARHMMTRIEYLDDVTRTYNGILSVRRLQSKTSAA